MIERIADFFGVDKQNVKAIEELAELQQAIARIQIDDRDFKNFSNMIEEIADVEIMISQIKYLHEINEEMIESFKREKIKRTLGRYPIEQSQSSTAL